MRVFLQKIPQFYFLTEFSKCFSGAKKFSLSGFRARQETEKTTFPSKVNLDQDHFLSSDRQVFQPRARYFSCTLHALLRSRGQGNSKTKAALEKTCQHLLFNLMLNHYLACNGPAKKMVLQFLQLRKCVLWVVPSLSLLLHTISSPPWETTTNTCHDSGNTTGEMLKCLKSLESAKHPHFLWIYMGAGGTKHLAGFGPVSADAG